MKLLTVMGLFLDLVGVVILGIGKVMKGAAALRSLKESYPDSFEYDIQQRPWYVRSLLRLGATLGARTIGAQHEPPPYRAFPLTVYGFFLLSMGFLDTVVKPPGLPSPCTMKCGEGLLTAFSLGFTPHIQRKARPDLRLRPHSVDTLLH